MQKHIKLIFLIMFLPLVVHSEEWHVKKSKDNLVKFTSSTPVLDFDGTTDNIDGYIYWEDDEIFGKNNQIYFEVDLNSVETGIGKRDRDMREDVLHTQRWPETSFKGEITDVEKDKIEPEKYNVKAKGKMFLHGHEKEMEVNAVIRLTENNMNVVSDFSVFLKDYSIEAPSLLAFVKVAEEIKLHLEFQLEKISENKN